MPKNEYILPVYNTTTARFETVQLNEKQYNAVRRGKWNIEAHDRRFNKHEIQFSDLIGGDSDDGHGYERFHEFISNQDDPQIIIERYMALEAIAEALSLLNEEDLALILAIFICEKSEREYAKEIGEHQVRVHRRKRRILKILREMIDNK